MKRHLSPVRALGDALPRCGWSSGGLPEVDAFPERCLGRGVALQLSDGCLATESQWLSADGEPTGLIKASDWSTTPLGPANAWPQGLRTGTALLLNSAVPVVMLWGEDGFMNFHRSPSTMLVTDASLKTKKAPATLGRRVGLCDIGKITR